MYYVAQGKATLVFPSSAEREGLVAETEHIPDL